MSEGKYSNSSNENININYTEENYTDDDNYAQKKIEPYNSQFRKKKKVYKNNGWNDKKENLLKYWKEEAQIIIWLNSEALNSTKFINKCLSIPAIFISAVSSASLFSNVNVSEDRINIVIILIGILLMISTIIQSLKEFLNLDKNIRQYITIIKNNQILVLEIEEQLNQDIFDRENGVVFLKKIKHKKSEMVKNSVEIPSRIYKKLEKEIEKGNIINYKDTFILYNYLQKKSTNQVLFNNSIKKTKRDSNTSDNVSNSYNITKNKRDNIKKQNNNLTKNQSNTNTENKVNKIKLKRGSVQRFIDSSRYNTSYENDKIQKLDNSLINTKIIEETKSDIDNDNDIDNGNNNDNNINNDKPDYHIIDITNINENKENSENESESEYENNKIQKNTSLDSSDDNLTQNCINDSDSSQMKMYAKQIRYQLGRL